MKLRLYRVTFCFLKDCFQRYSCYPILSTVNVLSSQGIKFKERRGINNELPKMCIYSVNCHFIDRYKHTRLCSYKVKES